MKLVVKMEIDGQQVYEVVEADNAAQAINKAGLGSDSESELWNLPETVFTGVYELGQTNLMENLVDKSEIHRFYHNKIEDLGFDPITYEKLVD